MAVHNYNETTPKLKDKSVKRNDRKTGDVYLIKTTLNSLIKHSYIEKGSKWWRGRN